MNSSSIEYIFNIVCKQLPEAGVEFLMIGGHAVNHYGYSRATVDVDFMIASDDVASVRAIMKEAGFSNVSESDNVIFFGHPDNPHRVDFLKVDRESMVKLMGSAVMVEYSGGAVVVPSLRDLISMKLFALANGSGRREEKDLPDIVNLVSVHKMSMAELKGLCVQFGDDKIFDKLKAAIREMTHD